MRPDCPFAPPLRGTRVAAGLCRVAGLDVSRLLPAFAFENLTIVFVADAGHYERLARYIRPTVFGPAYVFRRADVHDRHSHTSRVLDWLASSHATGKALVFLSLSALED